MKLVCSQVELRQQLALVSRAVSPRPTQPILSNVLFEAIAPDQLTLTAFDTNLGLRTQLTVQVLEAGATALPARLLGDIVAKLPEGDLTLTQASPSEPLTLTCETGEYQLRGSEPEDFPALPEVTGEPLTLSIEAFLQGIGHTLFAASGDESKQVLTGVHVQGLPTGLEFAATDGHRLATVQVEDTSHAAGTGAKDWSFTVPGRTLRELERILSSQAIATLDLLWDRSQVVIRLPNLVLTSRLLEGQYPNYQQLMPSQFERLLTVERRPLMAALERIEVFAEQRNYILKFSLSAARQMLEISVEAPDVGGGKDALPVQLAGDDLDIAFNVKYLLDALKVMDAADVKLQLNGSTQPVVIEPLGATPLKYLIMPVQLRNFDS